jgi:hypothetical protein
MILFIISFFLLFLVFIIIRFSFKNNDCVEFSEDTIRDWDEYEMLKSMEYKKKLVTAEYINGDKMYKHVYGDSYRDLSGHLYCDKIYTYNLEYKEECLEPTIRSTLPTNCKNCGAPLHSHECEYCGSEYY